MDTELGSGPGVLERPVEITGVVRVHSQLLPSVVCINQGCAGLREVGPEAPSCSNILCATNQLPLRPPRLVPGLSPCRAGGRARGSLSEGPSLAQLTKFL